MSGFVDWLSHSLHLVLGFGAAGAAIIALSVGKGSKIHKQAGWAYCVGMLVAALTTWQFMIARPLPLAMVQSTLAIYAIGMAVLALNPHWRRARMLEIAFTALLALLTVGALVTSARLFAAGQPFWPAPILLASILGYFLALDIRYLRRPDVPKIDRVRRHALRMALAVSETVRAPLLTFSDELGVPFPAIVFGTFLLIPIIFFAFAPKDKRAAAA